LLVALVQQEPSILIKLTNVQLKLIIHSGCLNN
jgi:hypothetical protein